MPLSATIYNTIFKRNSIYVATVFSAAFAFGISFDAGVQSFWDKWNQGKQWKDIRDKYVQDAEE
ncbi:ubiquinol-cytochrome C reductase [Dendrothele bispora CBS 962.96]|uniref:Complex III subunit 9 n=1 Tax=Dendrothele bispora (strain CBS 962.96) TaxID=1314807 RepID=A0A4V6T5P6_DENBC|nr:ubiquinol-cytochrome C reductase [Dendrothele bispora CBS 962.96]